MEHDLEIWEMAKIFGKFLRYMAQICGEMTYLFDIRLKNVENDLEIWEMAKIFVK